MIALVQVRSHGMAEVANGGHVTVRIAVGVGRWTVLTPCISVEASTKGLIPYRVLESSNEPLPGRAPIETARTL